MLETIWWGFEKPIRDFIVRFYVIYLGSLYVTLLVSGTYIALKRDRSVDWFFQLELLSFSLISLGIFVLGCLSLCYGTFRLFNLVKSVGKRTRWCVTLLSLAFPAMMLGLALLFLLLIVSTFK
jgi:hypothetical protein